jgi:hypothetical protein
MMEVGTFRISATYPTWSTGPHASARAGKPAALLDMQSMSHTLLAYP